MSYVYDQMDLVCPDGKFRSAVARNWEQPGKVSVRVGPHWGRKRLYGRVVGNAFIPDNLRKFTEQAYMH